MLARSVILNIIGQAGSIAVGFVASVALARWLGPSDRGLFAIMWLTGSVTAGICSLGLPLSISYHISRGQVSSEVALGVYLVWTALIAAVVVPLFWAFHGPIADSVAKGQGGMSWILVGALAPVLFLSYAVLQHLIGQLRFGVMNVLKVSWRVVNLVGLCLLVGLFSTGVAGAMGALVGGWLTVATFGSFFLLRDGRPRFERSALSFLLRYSLLVQIGSIPAFLSSRFDLFLLQWFVPLSGVGVYAVAQTVSEVVAQVPIAFSLSLLPLLAKREEHGKRELTSVALRHYGILAAVVVVGLEAMAPLIPALFGSDFSGAVEPALILLPGTWFLGITMAAGSSLQGYGRPGIASALVVLLMGLTVALDIVLIPPYGVTGAAIASAVSYTVCGFVSLFVLARVSGARFRNLILPRRGDLASYSHAASELRERLRERRRGSRAGEAR
jgi:O-antigen/teichoic acid export membrane protein